MYIDVKRKRLLTTIEFQNEPGRYIISLCIDDTPKEIYISVGPIIRRNKTGSLVGIEPRVTYLKPALQLNTSSRRLMSFQNSIDVDRRHRLERATVDSGWPFGDRMQSTND